jgi:hypothetical protein
MEGDLKLRKRPRDQERPMVCGDESSKQLVGEARPPPARARIGRKPGAGHARGGTCEWYMFTAPLEGRRRVGATEARTMADRAHQIKPLVDAGLPEAKVVRLVRGNLNARRTAPPHGAFSGGRGRRSGGQAGD